MMVPSRAPVHGASHRPGLVGSNGNHPGKAIAGPCARNEKQRTAIVLLSLMKAWIPYLATLPFALLMVLLLVFSPRREQGASDHAHGKPSKLLSPYHCFADIPIHPQLTLSIGCLIIAADPASHQMLVGLLADKGHLLISQLEMALGQWPLVRFENEAQAQSEVRALMTSMIHAWTQPDAIPFSILFNHWHPGSSHGDLFLRGPEEAHGSQGGQAEGHNIAVKPYRVERAWVQVKSSHPEHFLVYSFVIDSAQGEQERKALSEALQAKDAWIRSQALELLSDLDMTTLSDEVQAKRRFKDELKPKILSIFDEDVAFSILITHWSVH